MSIEKNKPFNIDKELGGKSYAPVKFWIDDLREPPEGPEWLWAQSVNAAKTFILLCERVGAKIELIDMDHDAGDFASDGGDYIKLLDWLEETGRSYPIRIHSMNPVGISNMRAIIRRNGWTEVRR